MALIKLLFIGLIVLSVIYVALSLYSRSVRREKLEIWFEEERATNPDLSPADKDAYVKKGLEEYDGSIRRKLILGVYIVPLVLMGTIVYLTNF